MLRYENGARVTHRLRLGYPSWDLDLANTQVHNEAEHTGGHRLSGPGTLNQNLQYSAFQITLSFPDISHVSQISANDLHSCSTKLCKSTGSPLTSLPKYSRASSPQSWLARIASCHWLEVTKITGNDRLKDSCFLEHGSTCYLIDFHSMGSEPPSHVGLIQDETY